MARARNIKPSIMDNEALAELAPLSRLLFIYLWMLADKEGRLEDRPKRIAAQALPYDRDADVNAILDDLARSGFITRYVSGGVACIQISAFTKHQNPHVREAASTLPALEPSQGTVEHQPRQVLEQERDDTHLAESLRKRVIERDGGKCLACGSTADLHVDHVIPRARGGNTNESNLQTLCRLCNQRKGARNHTDYRSTNLGTVEHQPRSPDSLIPDSLIPDTPSLIPDSKPIRAARSVEQDGDEFFEDAWKAYPSRPGASKADSLKAWRKRVKDGADHLAILAGVKRYADYCKASETEPQFIKQPATFFGPGEHYLSDWTVQPRASPPALIGRQARIDNYAAQAAAARGEHGEQHGICGTERDITGEVVIVT